MLEEVIEGIAELGDERAQEKELLKKQGRFFEFKEQ